MEFKKVQGHPMMEEKKDPMSGALPNQKTTFREISNLDPQQETNPLKAEFAYPGTDKGVAQ